MLRFNVCSLVLMIFWGVVKGGFYHFVLIVPLFGFRLGVVVVVGGCCVFVLLLQSIYDSL